MGSNRTFQTDIERYMKYLVIFIPIIFLSSCYHISDDIPDDTAKVLRMAGNNRSELERVLEYYRGDSLKFRAACFLIANMADEYAIVPTDTSDIYCSFDGCALQCQKKNIVWMLREGSL